MVGEGLLLYTLTLDVLILCTLTFHMSFILCIYKVFFKCLLHAQLI
jgi:hypothetical protein